MTALAFAAPRRSVRVPVRAPAARGGARASRTGAPTPGARAEKNRHAASRGRAPRRHARAAVRATWELRSFVGASAAIVVAFVLALAYLASSTGVATAGYEAQRLQAERDELRRQNALLDLELAKLGSPARIEAEARRLGLVRVSFIPVVPAVPLAARN